MPTPLLASLIDITSAATTAILQVYRNAFEVTYKSPGDPLTTADTNANTLICEKLRARFPSAAIVAEESPPEDFAGFTTKDQVFFVDPLDGTREFVARNGEFVVMIGLVEAEGVRAGVIHAPVSGLVWCGEVGKGAWRIDEDGSASVIQPSSHATLQGAKLAVSRSRTPRKLRALASRAGIGEVVRIGSAGLKGAAVAEGSVDLYVAPGNAGCRWDVCAPDAIITAAGGALTDAFGERYDYRDAELDNTRGIAAGNTVLHAEALDWLRRNTRSTSVGR